MVAKEPNIPLPRPSQLKRAPDIRADHQPVLSDLRDSDDIDQDADLVEFILCRGAIREAPSGTTRTGGVDDR